MAQRINEDIRFYLPADPYYYQVDNLPLEDLLNNDVRLQNQIDSIQSSDGGNTVGRAGFTELQPFIDTGLPGTVSVRPGNFIGRTQRAVPSGSSLIRNYNGAVEMNNPPTTFGTGDNPTGTYSVNNPANHGSSPGDHMARNALFNFMGGNVSIDSFDFNAFEFHSSNGSGDTSNTPPLGRIDLIGITTVNGAMDDAQIPGNPSNAAGVVEGDGLPKLAVVKGAGITTSNNGHRQVIIGEKYITVGQPQGSLNDYGRDLGGNVVPNPEFGTVPMPDDVVNVNFARDIMANGEISQTLNDWALSNKNASFFLPIAYVYVPQSHVEGAPIPQQYLSDIRPFFRTAELAYAERQAIAASLAPSIDNPFVTETHAKAIVAPAVTDLQNNLNDVISVLQTTPVERTHKISPIQITGINGGCKGWTRINASQWGGPAMTLNGPVRSLEIFWVAHAQHTGTNYVWTRSTDPNAGFSDNATDQRVLCIRNYGGGQDKNSNGNTVRCGVNTDGDFWYKVTGDASQNCIDDLHAWVNKFISIEPIIQ